MDELIQRIVQQLGLDPSVANAGISKTMAMLKGQVGDDLFGQVSEAIPGAAEAASSGAEDASGTSAEGGLLGKLAGMASAALGDKAGGGLELASALSAVGIDSDQLSPFIKTVVDFLQENLDDDLVNQILSKLPMLKTLLG